ncbi:MAG: hypothetical protein P1P82_17225 [Bacteroidales bacterium]|nr:hypothetical protein [Bacteroidales bacterium]MDT8432340.1 hypothetical protein [Bacteroidales bacterium]
MNIFPTILAKTTTGGTIEIIVLLLVAGIIAWFAAYFYYRSVYMKRINTLETENEGLVRKADGLQAANNELNDRIRQLEQELGEKK